MHKIRSLALVLFFCFFSSVFSVKKLDDVLLEIQQNQGSLEEWRTDFFEFLFDRIERVSKENRAKEEIAEIISMIIKRVFLTKHSSYSALKSQFDTPAILERYNGFIKALGEKKKESKWGKYVPSFFEKSASKEKKEIKNIFYITLHAVYCGIMVDLPTQQYEAHFKQMAATIREHCSFSEYANTISSYILASYEATWNLIYSPQLKDTFQEYLEKNKHNERCRETKMIDKLQALLRNPWSFKEEKK